MIIAIPSDVPGGLDAAISEHFGHCAAFTLVEVEQGKIGEVRVVENGGHEQGGCLAPVMILKNLNVDVLLAGGMGMRPLAGFQQAGIAVHFKETAEIVRDAVTLFVDGKCQEFGAAQTCAGGGHCGGHEHEEIKRDPIEGRADVRDGRLVTLEFELKDAEGNLYDSSKTRGPMRYVQGSGGLVGLEKGLMGLEAGAHSTIHVSAAEGFGPREESRIIEVPRDRIPEDASVGDILAAHDGSGQRISLLVLEVTQEIARLDANHPLAGKDLVFDVTVLKVEAATAQEIHRGHAY